MMNEQKPMISRDKKAIELFSGKRTTGRLLMRRGQARDLRERFGDIPIVEVPGRLDEARGCK